MSNNRKPSHPAPDPEAIGYALEESRRLAELQRLEEAARLLGKFPNVVECVFRRGGILLTLERWAEAENCFRKILSAVPGHFDSAMGLAGALVEQGKPQEALPLLLAAAKAKPQVGRVRYFHGVALDECGRTLEAGAELAAARQLLVRPAEARQWLPWEIYVQISRRCNLKCAMCGHEVWKDNTGFMDWPVFDRVLEQAKAHSITKINVLAGQGEPLLNPHVFEMLEKAVGEGFEVHITTNGTPLTPERIERFARVGLASIQFSFAGWDAQSYESTYVGAKFERTLANLKALQEATRATGTDFFVKAVVTEDNWAEVYRRTRAFLNEQGVDKVFTVIANNFGGNVNCGSFNERHGVWSLKKLDHQRRMPCRVPLTAVGVFCDGTVTACGCYDSNALLKVGNIMERDLAEIRQGEEFQRFMAAHRSGDLSEVPMCKGCDDPFG